MDIERELEILIDKHKGKQVGLGEIRLDCFAEDCLKEIRRLKAEIARQSETEMVVCPDCGGSGIYQEYDDEFDRYHVHACATCDGAGSIANQPSDEGRFPDEAEREYNANYEAKCKKTGINLLAEPTDEAVRDCSTCIGCECEPELGETVKGCKAYVKREDVQIEINRLQESLNQTKEAAKELKEQKYTVNMLPVYNQIKSLELQITALQAYQPWVRVEDRLPEDGQKILVYIKYDADTGQKNFVRQATATVNKHNPMYCYNDLDAYTSEQVTHWKPLPEPPKGE